MTVRLAVLVACHNRREHTLACLAAVEAQADHDAQIDVILLDAGSTDGTAQQVREQFPAATVLAGNTDLYWNAGMRVAFSYAVDRDYDYYLWLNDDTVLDRNTVALLLRTEQDVIGATDTPAIVVGSTRSPRHGTLTYGGLYRPNPRRPTRFALVYPDEQARECETMNGNCVLLSRDVVMRVGLLDRTFSHAMGDYDYGLRARQAGCTVWIAPGTVATCDRTRALEPMAPSPVAVLRRLREPKGLPFAEWVVFTRRWAGRAWPLYALSPYVRRVGSSLRR